MEKTASPLGKFPAWSWGGGFGLMVVVVTILFVAVEFSVVEDLVAASTPPAAPQSQVKPATFAFILGVAFAGLVQLIGYTTVWLAWWARRKF